jgi:hypothetical protein
MLFVLSTSPRTIVPRDVHDLIDDLTIPWTTQNSMGTQRDIVGQLNRFGSHPRHWTVPIL